MLGGKTGHKGFNVKEIPADVFIDSLSKHFETSQLIKSPEWADLVKTGCLKQMPPSKGNWWFTRAASIARLVYLHNGLSVSELANRYGGNHNQGVTPKHHRDASRKIVRTILMQLETVSLVNVKEGDGRAITPKGQRLLDSIAIECGKHL